MNIYEALILARKQQKAIKQKKWMDDSCLYHGIDNVLRWYRGNDNMYGDNGAEAHLSVALLLSTDWELSEYSYHNFNSDHQEVQ